MTGAQCRVADVLWRLRQRMKVRPHRTMNEMLPEAKPPRRRIHTAYITFVIGFFATLLAWGWLIARAHPGHQWWAVWRATFTDIIISVFGGLCFAVASILIVGL